MSWTQLFPIRTIGSAVTSWLAKTAKGVSTNPVITGSLSVTAVEGVIAAEAPIVALTRGVTGSTVTTSADGSTLPVTGEGVATGSTLRGILSAPTEGLDVVSTTTDLVQATFCVTASSTGTWSSEANAEGSNNGTDATNTNTIFNEGSGSLTLVYAAQFNKTELTINSAELNLYWESTAALAGPGTNTIEYSLNGGASWSTVINTTAAQSFATTPQVFSITAAVGQSWSSLTDLRVRYTYTAAAGLASTVSVDAVKLIVNATQTVLG